ncbi:hypothetical protein AS850_15460 [Frondihabitans sp. 762G35]|uniref:hypothetical protein n=1 Tax=Frondihabitans sp. 762G35 TaxID=1446794 RepID=UPI000D2088E6|nr:hypothetical protein [Frondihabitans sp. 762G35]ARC58484.1 hypothetical protein AS850_15460 [Frondihabitans sp. 762G35]
MRKEKTRRPPAQTPFDGVPGFWGRLNRFMYPIAGPASIGAGHPEEPYRAPVDPVCPICGAPMAEHVIRRGTGNRSTALECPAVRA